MKTSTINLSLPRRLLTRADRVAEEESRSRSELMRAVLNDYLERKERWQTTLVSIRRQARVRGITPADIDEAIREVRRAR